MTITILHTNDLHGSLTPSKAAFIRELRRSADLYFDSGDCIKAGNLAIPLKPDPAWRLLAEAGCDAGTLGNRESHILEKGFEAKLAGHTHPLLCANLTKKEGSRPLPSHMVFALGVAKVGVFGVMVPMVTERMAAQAASAYLWDPPIPAAIEESELLKMESEFVVALTHIGLTQDKLLAERCQGLNLILGGHSHSILQAPLKIGSAWICQGGSHGRFIGRYVWEVGRGLVSAELIPLPA